MGKKRKTEPVASKVPTKEEDEEGAKKKKEESDCDESDLSGAHDVSIKQENAPDFDEDILLVLPPTEDLHILLNRIELQLPKDDHVKYDSRSRKLDWEQIKFKEYTSEDCKKYWEHIQARIRRFRIMSEMIPDARQWLSQPWTNFYKSKDHNRHPQMPKKPLSMYMLYYSERREDIQKDNPQLSMPEVAKICSDEYQKLPEKRKAKFKSRCDAMRKEYDEKLEQFYHTYPEMRPVKTEKAAKSAAYKANMMRAAEPEKPVILLPGAPQKPGKPFDLFFQQQMEGLNEQTTERGVLLERARQEWRDMKVKKKSKWIRKAMKEFREYEERVVEFKARHPEFNPPSVKSFLTQEEQKILDKCMGRPEKPPSSAYSLFSKEMLNTESIKQFPSKERMAHISEAWKKVSDTVKETYQSQVNEAMTKYKQEYNEWYDALTTEEQKAEKERTATKSSKKNQQHNSNTANHPAANMIIMASLPGSANNHHMGNTHHTLPHHHHQASTHHIVSMGGTSGSGGGGSLPPTISLPTQPLAPTLQTPHQPHLQLQASGQNIHQNKQQQQQQQQQLLLQQQLAQQTPIMATASPIQMPPITVPYHPGQHANGQPMFVKVEVVGGPQGGHAQLLPQISIPNTATSVGYTIQQPYTFQIPAPPSLTQQFQAQPYQAQQQPLQQQSLQPQAPPQPSQQPPAPPVQQPPQQVLAQSQQPQPVYPPHQIIMTQPQQQQQQSWIQVKQEKDRLESLRSEILRREPVEPARSHKQLFISDFLKKGKKRGGERRSVPDSKLLADARDMWKNTDKKEKKKWLKMLEPQRQRYIEAYTIFVRGLNKEELELYTEMKARRDAEEEARRANESTDEEESSSEDDSDSDSESGSDSDL